MNVNSGQLLPFDEVKALTPEEQAKYIEVRRDLTEAERSMMKIKMYSPCACGSGKKFKFCCHANRETPSQDVQRAIKRELLREGYAGGHRVPNKGFGQNHPSN